ncbi:unnamed protein product [Schistocephalus solidus]|uniref:Uncharacterized protein n=1 Tax=Schistocephalus solidus TaxID=70667 RepID=A0A183TSE5_SCHSO|nr:unnamed protein product [Schistocephalus solidus]
MCPFPDPHIVFRGFFSVTKRRETSLAASLLRERMRMEYSGISDLKVDVDTGCVLVLMGGQLLHFFDNQWGINSLSPTQSANNDESSLNGVTRPTLIPVPSPLQPAICPMNPYLVAMVSDIDLILASVPPPQPATGVDASATPPTIINLTNLPANGCDKFKNAVLVVFGLAILPGRKKFPTGPAKARGPQIRRASPISVA